MGMQTSGHNGTSAQGLLKSGPMRAFSYPNFRFLWGASFLSIMSFFMVMLARGWLVLEMTDSPFQVTAVQGISMIPMAILPPIGGVIADRLDRRIILIASDVANLLFLLVMTFLLFTERIEVWHIFALALLNGVSFSFTMPTRAAMVPDVVGPGQAASGVAIFTTIFSTSQLVGPFMAGYLLDIDPDKMGWPFLAATLMLVPSVALLIAMRLPQRTPGAEGSSETSVLQSIGEGVAYIRGKKLLVGLLLLGLVFSLFGGPYQTLLPVFARDILHTGPEGLGWLAGAGGVGAIAGSFAVAFLSKPRQLQALTVAGGLGFGITLMMFSSSTLLPLSLALSLGLGFLMQIFMTSNFTLVNVAAPNYIRGRVMGVRYVVMGMGPIGVFGVGFAAEAVSAPLALGAAGAISLVLIPAVMLAIPALRRIEAELQDTTLAEGRQEPAPVGSEG